jgi:hypothetical protein
MFQRIFDMRRTVISTAILASLLSGTALGVPVVDQRPGLPPGWIFAAGDAEPRVVPDWVLNRGNEADPSGVEFQDGRNGNGLRYGQGAGAGNWDEMPTTLDDGWMLSLLLPPAGQPTAGPPPAGQDPTQPGSGQGSSNQGSTGQGSSGQGSSNQGSTGQGSTGSGSTGGQGGGQPPIGQPPLGQPPVINFDEVPVLPVTGPVDLGQTPTEPVDVPEPGTLTLLGLGLLGLGFARRRASR